MKHLFAYILVIGSSGFLTAQTIDTLSLDEYLAMALSKSLAIYEADATVKTADLDLQLLQAQLKPQLNLNGTLPNYVKTFRETSQPNGSIQFQSVTNNNSSLSLQAEQTLAGSGGVIFAETSLQRFDDFDADFTQYNGVPIRLGIAQPIFQFNPWKWNRKIQIQGKRVADRQFNFTIESINIEAQTLFMDVLDAYQNYEIAKNNKSYNDELLAIAQERYALGKISENDLLQLQLDGIRSERNTINAYQALINSSSAAYQYLGMSYEGQIIAPMIPDAYPNYSVDTTMAITQAEENRFEYDLWRQNALIAERDVDEAVKNAGLQMDLVAAVGFSRSADMIDPIYTDPQDQQFVQLNFQMPISNGRLNRIAKQRAIVAQDLQRIQQERQTTELENRVQVSVLQLEQARQALSLAESLKDIALRRFDIARQSFVLGSLSTTELGIAQQEKDNAVRQYIQSVRAFWQSHYDLRLQTLFDFEKQESIIY